MLAGLSILFLFAKKTFAIYFFAIRIARCVMICGAAIGICTMLGDEFADGYSQGYKKGYKAGSGDEAMSILKDLALCGKTIFKDPDTGSKREFKVTE